MSADHRDELYVELEAERLAQDRKWGEQNHPDGTGGSAIKTECNGCAEARLARYHRLRCQARFSAGLGTWADIFRKEVFEALAEPDPARLRAELLQVAAVAVAWVEAIDRRAS